MSRPPSTENVFRALGHPVRRRVVELLAARNRTAGELLAAGRLRQPTLSAHLRVLRLTGVIQYQRRGTRLVYRLNRGGLARAGSWVSRLQRRR